MKFPKAWSGNFVCLVKQNNATTLGCHSKIITTSLWRRRNAFSDRRNSTLTTAIKSSSTATTKSIRSSDCNTSGARHNGENHAILYRLGGPIGLPRPPMIGEDYHAAARKKWKSLTGHEKHLIKRQQIKAEMATPYFREITSLKFHGGKTFLANPRIFKRSQSLFFPNFQGFSLGKNSFLPSFWYDDRLDDSTAILRGKLSVVSVMSGLWAENQTQSFVGPAANPGLHTLIRQNKDVSQIVQIDIEPNFFRAWLQRAFLYKVRRLVPKELHHTFLYINKTIPQHVRSAIAYQNSKVGYVYLVDAQCRIRWAACGQAEEGENDHLVNGMYRMMQERCEEDLASSKLQ